MGKREVFSGIGLMILSMLVFGLTFQFPKQTLAVAPSVFPRVISIGLFILAGILTFQGINRMNKSKQTKTEKIRLDITLKRIGILIIIAFIYTRILNLTGYLCTTPFFIAGVMVVFNERRWIWIGGVSIGTTVLLYFLFRFIFRVPLPRFGLF